MNGHEMAPWFLPESTDHLRHQHQAISSLSVQFLFPLSVLRSKSREIGAILQIAYPANLASCYRSNPCTKKDDTLVHESATKQLLVLRLDMRECLLYHKYRGDCTLQIERR